MSTKQKVAGFDLPGLPPSRRRDYPVVEAVVETFSRPTAKGRTADRKLLEVAKLFVPAKGLDVMEGTSGNIQADIKGNQEYEDTIAWTTAAPYLLARLCALFEGLQVETHGQTAYKITWSTCLVHPETGHRLTFYDWKGCSSIGSDVSGKEVPKAFLRDVKKLIKVLQDDKCPHPYDGCVVGEVA